MVSSLESGVAVWRQGRNPKSLLGGCSKEGHLASYIRSPFLKGLATKVNQFRALTLARCFFDLNVSFQLSRRRLPASPNVSNGSFSADWGRRRIGGNRPTAVIAPRAQ